MHVDCADLIMRYLLMQWSDDGLIWKPNIPSRSLESQDHFYDMQ